MNDFMRKHWFKAAVGFICVILAAVIVYNRLEPPKMKVIGDAGEFELTDLKQEKVSLANTNGKVRLIYFYFSNCPDVCGPTTYMLSQVQKGLKEEGIFGDEAAIISITFDPQRDTIEQLQEFSGRFNADPRGWYFLRGDEQYTKEVAEKYGVTVIKDNEGNFAHLNLVLLADKDGKLSKRYNANNTELKYEDIVDDMVRLNRES